MPRNEPIEETINRTFSVPDDVVFAKESARVHHGAGAPDCPGCDGVGYISYGLPLGDPGFGKIHNCPECRQEDTRNACGVTDPEAWERTVGDYYREDDRREMEHVVLHFIQQCQTNQVGRNTWKLIQGPLGCGKTTWAQRAIVELHQAGRRDLLYVDAPTYKIGMIRSFGHDGEPAIISRMLKARILVVDQVVDWAYKVEDPKKVSWAMDWVRTLVDMRYRERNTKATLWVINDEFHLMESSAAVGVIRDRFDACDAGRSTLGSMRSAIGEQNRNARELDLADAGIV